MPLSTNITRRNRGGYVDSHLVPQVGNASYVVSQFASRDSDAGTVLGYLCKRALFLGAPLRNIGDFRDESSYFPKEIPEFYKLNEHKQLSFSEPHDEPAPPSIAKPL
jgi:hypothetical protein